MKKLLGLLTSLVVVLGVSSCGVNGSCVDGACGNGAAGLDLDAVNEYFAEDDYWANMNANGNKVTLIPFTHINGPKVEWEFFAVVNFEYNAKFYYKYQVTYLSCTCRTADVNYWQTAYVELSVPGSGQADDVVLKTLSFDNDSGGHYLGGFWGDSGVNGYDINGTGMTYQGIKEGFIPYLVGKTYADLKNLSTYDSIAKADFNSWASTAGPEGSQLTTEMYSTTEFDEHGKPVSVGQQPVNYDMFLGSSVSTNNIIRIVNALITYHAANNI